MKSIDAAGIAFPRAFQLGDERGRRAAWLPGTSIFDNLFVRVSAEVGRHSCEKGK
jgi:hypothetical protein